MTSAQISTYKAALKEAREAFGKASSRRYEINREAEKLDDEISRLRRTITALAALCSESPGFDKLGITDSVMEVMEEEEWTLDTGHVVLFLEARGFDLSSQKNASASVHAVLTRLAEKGKITKITDEKTGAVSWRGPRYDPKTEEPPF